MSNVGSCSVSVAHWRGRGWHYTTRDAHGQRIASGLARTRDDAAELGAMAARSTSELTL